MPPIIGLAAVVRDDQHHRVVVQQSQPLANLAVEVDIVVADGIFVGVARLVQGVALVKVLPEAMVDAIHAHVHVHEKVPGLGRHQVLDQLVVLIGQLVDLLQQVVLVLGAELGHVEHVFATHQALRSRA